MPIEAGATRRGLALDEVYTNMKSGVESKAVLYPLTKSNGVPSDHGIIASSIRLPKHRQVTSTKFSFRPVTSKGIDMFGKRLDEFDWTLIRSSSPTESAAKLNSVLQGLVEECFELKERNCLLYTSPSPRDGLLSRMPSSA